MIEKRVKELSLGDRVKICSHPYGSATVTEISDHRNETVVSRPYFVYFEKRDWRNNRMPLQVGIEQIVLSHSTDILVEVYE